MQGQSNPNNNSDPPTPPTQPTTPLEQSPSQRAISPARSSEEKNILSPKSGSRRPQSPGVYKGKLDIVKKFLEKEEAKYSQFDTELTPLTQEKEALEQQLEEKQELAKKSSVIGEGNDQVQKELQELRTKNQDLIIKIDNLKKVQQQKILTEKELLSGKIQVLKVELDNKRRQEEQNKADGSNRLNELRNNTAKCEAQAHQHEQELHSLNQRRQQLSNINRELEENKKEMSRQIELLNTNNQSQQRQQELRRTQLEARIKQARQRINTKKSELQDLKYKQGYFPDPNSTPTANEIREAKKNADILNASIKKVEGQLAARKRDAAKSEDEEKKREKKVEDLRKKVEDLQIKKEGLKTEIQTIDANLEKKPVKYEQKVPEQLLEIRSKNDAIRREIIKINDKIQNENVEMERLVPPAVIENMNKKISTIIANNERLSEVSKIIDEISKENQVLAEQRENLEWGENNYLTDLENQRRKQQQKNKSLEEQVQGKKKTIQQQNAKLEEYIRAYPEFKPKKKPEPKEKIKKQNSTVNQGDKSPTAVKGKKQGSKSAINAPEEKAEESKRNKKKKKTAESDIVKEEVKEEVKEQEVIQPPPPKKETTKTPQAEPTKKKNKKR